MRNYVKNIEVAFAYREQIPDPKKSLQNGTEVSAQQSAIPESIDKYVDRALSLDFTQFPRPSRCNTGIIRIHEGKQAKQSDRLMVLLTVYHWGWTDPKLSYKNKLRIARAVSQQVSYDAGYTHPFAHSQVMTWDKTVEHAIKNGTGEVTSISKTNHKGSVSYVDKIDNNHPGYLHELYRYATKIVGHKSSFAAIAIAMNEKSSVSSENRMTLHLSREQVNNWFKINGGKEYSPIEKPLDTDIHRKARLIWVRKHFNKLTSNLIYVCYLDEKWFYTTNRRNKIKKLPRGVHEPVGVDIITHPKIVSRRYPIKSMFLGVVGRPIPYRGFDGKVLLERVSKDVLVIKQPAHQNFSDDILVNSAIKEGECRYFLKGNFI